MDAQTLEKTKNTFKLFASIGSPVPPLRLPILWLMVLHFFSFRLPVLFALTLHSQQLPQAERFYPIHVAAMQGDYHLLRLLVAHGADFQQRSSKAGCCRAHDDHEFEAAMGLNGLNQAFDADMTNHNEVMRHFIRDFVDGDPKNGHFHGKMMPLTVTIHFS